VSTLIPRIRDCGSNLTSCRKIGKPFLQPPSLPKPSPGELSLSRAPLSDSR